MNDTISIKTLMYTFYLLLSKHIIDFFFKSFGKKGLINDHIPNLFRNFYSFGGDNIAYLSWLASVSHFVIDFDTYWNP